MDTIWETTLESLNKYKGQFVGCVLFPSTNCLFFTYNINIIWNRILSINHIIAHPNKMGIFMLES